MAVRFRRTVRLFPGVRLNFSKTGLSASLGGAPFTLNVGRRGLVATTGVPGTGLSVRTPVGPAEPQRGKSGAGPLNDSGSDEPPSSRPSRKPETAEIASAALGDLSSEGLTALLAVLHQAGITRTEALARLPSAEALERRLGTRAERWRQGWLLRRLLPGRFAHLLEEARTAEEELGTLREQVERCAVDTSVDAPEGIIGAFRHVVGAFEELCRAECIWDTTSERSVDQRAERSTATMTVGRTRVAMRLLTHPLVRFEQAVPMLANANGGDLFLYPVFLLVQASEVHLPW